MMEVAFKSVKIYLRELISELEYADFQPQIDPSTLKAAIEKLLCRQNAYWELITSENWQNWIFIRLRTFKPWEPVNIGFLCGKRELTLVIFDELNGTRFHKEYLRNDIDLIDAWINHEHLFDGFCNVILAAIKFTNRPSTEDTFESIYKSMIGR